MELNKNKKIYNEYFESSFKYSNILTEKQYHNSCVKFEWDYGQILPNDKNAKILDIGCGTGHFLYYLNKKGYNNFLGIDLSSQQIEFCKNHISPHVIQADAIEFLKNKEKEYKIIIAHDFLEHIQKDQTLSFLNLVYHALKTKGTLILRVPNMSNPFSLDSRYRDFTHEIGFTEDSLYQIACITGFRDIDISSTRIQVRTFRNWIRNTLVNFVHQCIRFAYYIQDFKAPKNLGKNLIAICKK